MGKQKNNLLKKEIDEIGMLRGVILTEIHNS